MATFNIEVGTDYIEVWLTGLQSNYQYARTYELLVYEYDASTNSAPVGTSLFTEEAYSGETESPHCIVDGLEPDTHYNYVFYCYHPNQETFFTQEDDFWTDEETSSGGSDDEEEENYFSKRKVVSTNITSSKSSSTTTPEYSIDYVRVKVSQASQIDVRVEGSEDICLYYKLGTTSSGCNASISDNTTPVLNWSKKIDKKSIGAETTSFTMMDGDSYAYAEIGWYECDGYKMDVDYEITITPLVTNYTITYALGTASKWSDGTTGTKTQTKPSNSSVTLTNYTAITNDGTGTKTITFNGNGATSLTKSSQTSTITAKYTHNGWSTSSGGSKSYELQGTYSTNENVTLYPTFSSTLSYSNITLPTESECQRTGYTLLGWATSSSATTAAAAPGAEYSVTSTTSTLYAVWELNTYAVKYNIGSGVEWQGTLIDDNKNPSQTKKHGVALTLRSHAELNTYRNQDRSVVDTINFEANGGASSVTSQKVYQYITYEHNGWNTNSASNGTRYGFSGSYTANAAVTLYPHFNKTIDYNYITMPNSSKCTQKGYVLKGWATTSNATSVNYTPGQSVYGADIVSPVLYAIWEPDKYTATYICYSSSGKHLRNQRFTASYGSRYTASFPQITGYQTPDPITDVMGPEDKSYTITYPLINYPININCNGGSGVSNSTYTIESSAITIGTPTRTGYTFTGWTGSNGATPQTSVTISANSYGEKSYTANWTANTYTYNISYKSKSGKVLNTQSVNGVFDTTNLITPPAFTGYTTPSAQNITWDSVNPKQIEFVYEPIEYTLSINYNNGTPYISDTYTIESGEKILQSQSRNGYAFCGWTGTEITSPQETVTIPSGSIGARAYVATWAPLIVFNFKKSDTDLLKNLTNPRGIAINWYASESQMKEFINKVKNYCNKTITLSEQQTLDNYNAIVDALNNSSAPIHFSGTTKPNLTKKSKDSYIQAQDLLNLENAFNNRKFI